MIVIAILVLFESVSGLFKYVFNAGCLFQVSYCLNVEKHLNQVTRQDFAALSVGGGRSFSSLVEDFDEM